MGFGKRENTFDWRIYMKKVPIKELREDLKEKFPNANIDEKYTIWEVFSQLDEITKGQALCGIGLYDWNTSYKEIFKWFIIKYV